MIVAIIVVLLLLSAMSDWADAKDWEASESNAERRHQEALEVYERKLEAYEEKVRKNKVTKATRTRAIKDRSGRTLVEEVVIEGDFDYD